MLSTFPALWTPIHLTVLVSKCKETQKTLTSCYISKVDDGDLAFISVFTKSVLRILTFVN